MTPRWPETWRGDYCGEHEPRPRVSLPASTPSEVAAMEATPGEIIAVPGLDDPPQNTPVSENPKSPVGDERTRGNG